MTHRYALRFQEGERRGELVALTGATTTFGRKPGNSVQLLDASVSGKHAEIVVDDRGGLLRDLGSTNGTRVNGERISEKRLAGGDRVMFGTVDLIFVDNEQRAEQQASAAAAAAGDIGLELEADEPRASSPARTPSALELTSVVESLQPPGGYAGDAVRSIGAEKLARSNKKSILASVGLIVVAAGAGAAWWFTRDAAAGGASTEARAVTPVAGNLLAAGYSFENGELPAGWSNSTTALTAFDSDRAARASGKLGLSADLSPAGDALLASDVVTAGKALRLSCALGVRGRVDVRAGLRFESASGALLPVEAWGPWTSDTGGEGGALQEVVLQASVPPCYDRARALIGARSLAEAGKALVDDVAIVPADGAGAEMHTVKHEDVELVLLGQPTSSALLFKIDHPLVSGLRFRAANGSDLALGATEDPLGVRASAKDPAAKLEFAAEPGMAAGGIATTARDGFKTHQAQFERADVDSVVLGAGRELVRVRFDPPVVLRGRPVAGASGASFAFEAVGASSVLLQVAFNEERVAAQGLAAEAREAELASRPADAILAWNRLINEHPIDAALMQEAETGRSKALANGLAAVVAVRADVERARFFRLLDLFRECRAKSLKTAEASAGTEVETSALALAASVDADIELLARDLDKLEAKRLEDIHAALKSANQTRLAERVAAELKARFAVEPGAAQKNGGQR